MTDPGARIRELGDRARELAKLMEHPSWDLLRLELDAKRSQFMARKTRELISGGIHADPVNQREIDYQRGFFAGAEWILNNPEMAEATLKKALERMGRE